jgi:hypothetical protein
LFPECRRSLIKSTTLLAPDAAWRRWLITAARPYPVRLSRNSDGGFTPVAKYDLGSSAGNVKQVPPGVVDHFEIGIVGDILDALLRRDDLVITPP